MSRLNPDVLARFAYDPVSGVITNRVRRAYNAPVGAVAGNFRGDGYLQVNVGGGRLVLGHRLAWQLYYGESAAGHIDHIDGDPRNNRVDNLRCVDSAVNSQNMRRCKRNTSGATGVSWQSGKQKYRVQIMCHGRSMFFGYYDCLELAALVAREAYEKLGFHHNHGRVVS